MTIFMSAEALVAANPLEDVSPTPYLLIAQVGCQFTPASVAINNNHCSPRNKGAGCKNS